MEEIILKKSAIHNLIITNSRKDDFKEGEISEGLVLPENILEKSDILPWEQVIVTKINNSNNWINRIKTFIVPGKEKGKIEARGSLASFLNKGDLICLITLTILNEKEVKLFEKDQIPIFDLGFDPFLNKNNLIEGKLNIEYKTRKEIDVIEYNQFKKLRQKIRRFFLSSLILNLRINKTHPNCLQGSAELPENLMKKAGLKRYQSVSVYNASKGGTADTYVVPMPPKVVMTTGAMASFAKIGEKVNVASYIVSSKPARSKIIFTDGESFLRRI